MKITFVTIAIALASQAVQAIELEPGTWNCYYQDLGYVFTEQTSRPELGFAGFLGEMSANGCPSQFMAPYQSEEYLLDLVSDTERNSFDRLVCNYTEGAFCVFWGPDPKSVH